MRDFEEEAYFEKFRTRIQKIRADKREVLAMINQKFWKLKLDNYWTDLLQDNPSYFAY
jgi:hypothetical protein